MPKTVRKQNYQQITNKHKEKEAGLIEFISFFHTIDNPNIDELSKNDSIANKTSKEGAILLHMQEIGYKHPKKRVFIQPSNLIEQNKYNDFLFRNQNTYMSIAQYYPKFTDVEVEQEENENKKEPKGKPFINESNVKELNFIVIDFDPKNGQVIKEKDVRDLAFFLNQAKNPIPSPHSVVFSGSGFHLYYKIKKLILPKDTEKRKQAINLYFDTVKQLKEVLEFYLNEAKNEYNSFEILYQTSIDTMVSTSITQLIRLPTSYNPKAEKTSKIITLNTKLEPYRLGRLIKNLKVNNPYEQERQEKIAKWQTNNNQKTRGKNTKKTKNDKRVHLDIVETQRIENTLKYAKYLKENNELKGKKNAILTAIYRSSIARGDTQKETLELGYKLQKIYDSPKYNNEYIKNHYRYAEQNYKKYPILKNKTYYNFIGLDAETAKNIGLDISISNINIERELKQKEKRKENLKIGKTVYYNRRKKPENRLTQKELYQQFEISKNTLKKYEEIYKAMRSNSDYEKVKEKVQIKNKKEYENYILAYKEIKKEKK